MKLNKIFITLFLTILMFVCNMKVSADFDSPTGIITQKGSAVTTNGADTLALKYYEMKDADGNVTKTVDVFCTQFRKSTPAGKNLICSKYSWPSLPDGSSKTKEDISVGIAYIISKVGTVSFAGNAPENYYYGELAINEFLCNSGVDTSNTCVRESQGMADEILNTTFLGYYNTAMGMKYKKASIEFSSSQLTFSKSGDNYVSNEISIKNEVDDVAGSATVTSNIGTVVQNGNSFYVTVPVSSVAAGETVNVKVSASVSATNNLAYNFLCDEGNNYQTVTPHIIETLSNTATTNAEGSITAPAKGKIIINKYDSNNRPLSGATILVTGANGYNQRFVTDGTSIIINDLEYGKYSIDEEIAPDGYLKADIKTVTLSESNLTATIDLIDEPIKLSILKVNESGKPLAGVKLSLTNKEGETLGICKDSNGNNISCEWTTTKTSYDIYNLPAGTYYIKEISVPNGYNLNPNKIKVEIATDGTVKVDGKKATNSLVKVLNDLTRTQVSKISAVNGQELPGATIQILDVEGKSISCIIINKEGKNETLKECKWVSGEEPTVVLGLSAGKYFLEETIAPEGYELNKNKVEFEIKADGSVTKVQMKNELIVEVPDTLSSRSALLIAISMFDIALGIGIITYVKKNKVEE